MNEYFKDVSLLISHITSRTCAHCASGEESLPPHPPPPEPETLTDTHGGLDGGEKAVWDPGAMNGTAVTFWVISAQSA